MYIYKITNNKTSKAYIGRTTRTVEERWEEHKKKAKAGEPTHFYDAIRRDGSENFKVEVLYETNDLQDLVEKEEYYIKLYNTYYEGYNMTKGGEWDPMECSISKNKHTKSMQNPEVREKISKSMKEFKQKNPVSLETRRKLSEVQKGKVYIKKDGKETKVLQSEVDKYLKEGWVLGGLPERPEVVAQRSKKLYKKVYCIDEETKEKKYFNSVTEAAIWWHDVWGYTSTSAKLLRDRIKRSATKNYAVKGLKWFYVGKEGDAHEKIG